MNKQIGQKPITEATLTKILKETFKEHDKNMDKKFVGIDKKFTGLNHQMKEMKDGMNDMKDDMNEMKDDMREMRVDINQVRTDMNQGFMDIGQKLEDINDSVDAVRLIATNTKDNLEIYQKAHAKEHEKIEVGFAKLGLKYENIK